MQPQPMLWVLSTTAFLLAGSFLLDAINRGSPFGVAIGAAWLVNIVLGTFFIHIVLRTFKPR